MNNNTEEKTELTLKQFAFEIEDNIPIKVIKVVTSRKDPLEDAIYNYANKLLVKQSFFVQISLFKTTKYPQTKITRVLNKLVAFCKNNKSTVSFTSKVQKDAEGKVTGYRIWREE